MGVVSYEEYHKRSMEAGDVDPAITCLRYLADRFELNTSQRYWISFLYGTNYCAPTTFLMYNEFPDFEKVDIERMANWWRRRKDRLIFQTDRLRVKTGDNFVPAFVSYRHLTQGDQEGYFKKARHWKECYDLIMGIKHFGRFSTFNYLDTLNQLTDIRHKPTYLDMREAESCRNGICYAIGKDDWVNTPLTPHKGKVLHKAFKTLLASNEGNVFQIETTLCAYKKYRWGKRYVGYYIERMRKEIEKLERRNPEGVAWEALWQFRRETFDRQYLKEL